MDTVDWVDWVDWVDRAAIRDHLDRSGMADVKNKKNINNYPSDCIKREEALLAHSAFSGGGRLNRPP